MRKEYTFRQHENRWLVFAPDQHPSLALSKYVNFISHSLCENTFKAYSRQIRKWLSFLMRRRVKGYDSEIWNLEPEKIRSLAYTFLTEESGCRVKQANHHENAFLVRPKQEGHGNPRLFMASIASFYKTLRLLGFYLYRNPLVIPKEELEAVREPSAVRRMPQISGCEEPSKRKRFSDNYFVFEFREWKPKTIDCQEFPDLMRRGGEKVGWLLREHLICDILFETGCRISEVLALTLKDLQDFKKSHGATATSKGYKKDERPKFLGWTEETTLLLASYFDIERKKYDPQQWTLNDYLSRASEETLKRTPIFLSRHGTKLHVNTFRLRYWNPALKAARIKANIHQTRHWYVTRYMRHVFDEFNTLDTNHPAVAYEMAAFTRYMLWASPETLNSYNHLFTGERTARFQSMVHADLHRESPISSDVKNRTLEKKSALQEATAGLKRLFGMTGAKK